MRVSWWISQNLTWPISLSKQNGNVNEAWYCDCYITNHDIHSCFELQSTEVMFFDCTFGEMAALSFRPSLGVDGLAGGCSSMVLAFEFFVRFSGFDFCLDETCRKLKYWEWPILWYKHNTYNVYYTNMMESQQKVTRTLMVLYGFNINVVFS